MKVNDLGGFEPGKPVSSFSTIGDEAFYSGEFESLSLAVVSIGTGDHAFILGVKPLTLRAIWWPLSSVKCVEWEE